MISILDKARRRRLGFGGPEKGVESPGVCVQVHFFIGWIAPRLAYRLQKRPTYMRWRTLASAEGADIASSQWDLGDDPSGIDGARGKIECD